MVNKIKISDNGPLEVSGDFQLIDTEGNEYTKKRKHIFVDADCQIKNPFAMGPIKEAGLKAVREYQVKTIIINSPE
jgi:CDGSH iron-sulfur domain-containing protein 3